uniref:Niemann-Pick type C2 protein b n=1 Tax=Adelphocoris lineolatus TaxID=236346 RepID=A0A346RVH5_ADELI|nr:Niemann-Pick type C2 protein b [Adelphocoris lineolatus]
MNTMISHVLFVTLLAIHVCTCTTPHSDCANLPTFSSVSIGDCTEQPCILKSGTTVKFDLGILVHGYTTSMKVKIVAYAMGATVSYPLQNDDVCSNLTDAECPLDDGELVNYELLFPILESFPAVPCIVTVTVTSDQGIQGCMTVSLQVVK